MKTKKVPMRMCVLTHEKLPKKELLRIVISDNKIVGDLTGKLNGHGCYLKKDKLIIEEAKKRKILNRIFEMEVSDEVYEELLKLI